MKRFDPYLLLCAANGREISLDALAQKTYDSESGEAAEHLDNFLWREGLYVTAEAHILRSEFQETIRRTRQNLQQEIEYLIAAATMPTKRSCVYG